MPEISIIVPVYKVEAFLHRAVESILAQTYSDFELILVDDGSPDRSGEICDEYEKKDSRVRVLHQQNQGQAAARNYAVSLAKGKYVCFVDADDAIHSTMLECLYDNLIGSDAQISICDALQSKEIGAFLSTKISNDHVSVHTCNENGLLSLFEFPYICWVVWGKLIPIELVKQFPFTPGKIFEDNAITVKWLYHAQRIVYTEEKLYFYQVNTNGTTKGSWSEKRILDSFWYRTEQLQFFLDTNMRRLFTKHYDLFIRAISKTIVKEREEHPYLAKQLKRTLSDWWKKKPQDTTLTKGEEQYVLSILHPVREAASEWWTAHMKRK